MKQPKQLTPPDYPMYHSMMQYQIVGENPDEPWVYTNLNAQIKAFRDTVQWKGYETIIRITNSQVVSIPASTHSMVYGSVNTIVHLEITWKKLQN